MSAAELSSTSAAQTPALEASGLSIGYPHGRGSGWKVVHPRVDFTLRCGELTSLIGLNGAANRLCSGRCADSSRLPEGRCG